MFLKTANDIKSSLPTEDQEPVKKETTERVNRLVGLFSFVDLSI